MTVYDALARQLESSPPTPDAVAFPDGSVDAFYRLRDPGGPLSGREELVERLAAGEKSFAAEYEGQRPGGQAVNAARQMHALGATVALYGHLDAEAAGAPGLFDLPFETHSMGEPARVDVYGFGDDALMLSEASDDVRSWSAATFRAAGGPAAVDGAAAACCANWASFPGLTDVLASLADDSGGGVFVLDPGPLAGAGADDVRALADALGALAADRTVVVSANDPELDVLADRLGAGATSGDSADDGTAAAAANDDVMGDTEASDAAAVDERAATVREAAGVDAVVRHETEAAEAALPDGAVRVPNLAVEERAAATGGGDRFSGALACALAAGWPWEQALALGNACASHYVATGDSGDPPALAEFVESHDAR